MFNTSPKQNKRINVQLLQVYPGKILFAQVRPLWYPAKQSMTLVTKHQAFVYFCAKNAVRH